MVKSIPLAFLLLATVSTASASNSRIIGGNFASRGDFPFLVSLQKSGRHFCGGSLIDSRWILTAAHCVSSGTVGVRIRVGLLNQSDTNGIETFRVDKVILHPDYDSTRSDYDYALIRLKGASTYAPVALNGSSLSIPDEEDKAPVATTAGWGTTSEGGAISSRLLKVDVPLVSARRCESAYPSRITKSMLCAGFESGGKDSCQGDSGGPLVLRSASGERVLAGVVSWGDGCARPNKYGVYSDVSMAASWIASQLGVTP